jgi:hypothetical protein
VEFGNIKNHLLKKFIFPKRFIFDEPGIIFNKSISRLTGRSTFTRVVFFFEEFFVDLYKYTVKEIGEEETSKLWYGIGRDVGLRYLSFSGVKKVPRWMISQIIQVTFDAISGSGLGFFKKLKNDEDFFIVEGKHALIIRHINDGSFFAGVLSGIFSYIYGSDCDVSCVECSPIITRFEVRCRGSTSEFPNHIYRHKNYFIHNSSKQIFAEDEIKHPSLSDFLKFNKITLHPESNNWRFGKHSIFPSEIGLFGLIIEHYKNNNLLWILEESYSFSSEKIFTDLLSDQKESKRRIRYFLNLISAFGWGIPDLKINDDVIQLRFSLAPFSRYGSEDRAFFFRGALDAIFNRKHKLVKYTNSEFIYSF